MALAAGEAAVAAGLAGGVHPGGSDTFRIGLIGCGARGKGAAIEAIQAGRRSGSGSVQLVAMADVFANNLQTAYRTINGRHSDCVDVGKRRYVGLDAWRGVLAADIDVVILATPPVFRPLHFVAAVEAGKHVFMECPIAVDEAGLQQIAITGELARVKNLAIAVGHQRRHEARTRDCVEKLRDGMIGEFLYARTYSGASSVSSAPMANDAVELESQLRHWTQFACLGGDFADDRHLHSLDIVNWVLGDSPTAAQGFSGSPEVDAAYQLIEFTYPNDFPVVSQRRDTRGGNRQHGEHFHGTLGSCDVSRAIMRDRSGKVLWQSNATEIAGKGWQQQFNVLVDQLRAGERPFELDRALASNRAAIMGTAAIQSNAVV